MRRSFWSCSGNRRRRRPRGWGWRRLRRGFWSRGGVSHREVLRLRLLDHRQEGGSEIVQNLHRQRAREVVACRLLPGDERQHRSEKPIANKEGESRGAIHCVRGYQTSVFRVDMELVVPRAGFTADRKRRAVGKLDSVVSPAARPVLHYAEHLTPHQLSNLRA